MRNAVIAAALLILAGCGDADTLTEASQAPTAVETPQPQYVEEKGGIYYYAGAVSENDKADGKASGEVFAFKYLGKSKDGEHKVAIVNDAGGIDGTATCPDKCKVIHMSNGQKLQYSPDSIIGAVFDDAVAGHLKEPTKK